MLLQRQGIVIRPLADADITFETLLMWRRKETSPLVDAFRAIAREVWSQQEKNAQAGEVMHASNVIEAVNGRVHPPDTTKHQPR
jgi:hypothetical protein